MAGKIKFEDFDPNGGGATKLYGVWANDRNFKIYTNRGPATNRFGRWPRAKFYEFDPLAGTWLLRGVKDTLNQQPCCDMCGASTLGYQQVYDRASGGYVDDMSRPQVRYGGYRWERGPGRKLVDPMRLYYLCTTCIAHTGW